MPSSGALSAHSNAAIKRGQIASKMWDRRSDTTLIAKETISKYRKAIAAARSTEAKKAPDKEYLIIHNNLCGGSHKWVMDLRRRLGITTPLISSLAQLVGRLEAASTRKRRVQIIIVINSFLSTDITADDILDLHDEYTLNTVIPIHDWYWFCPGTDHTISIHNVYLRGDFKLAPTTVDLFRKCDSIVCPTDFVCDRVRAAYGYSNLIKEGWVDYDVRDRITRTKLSKDGGVNIGVLVDCSECKGSEQICHLREKYSDISILRVGMEIEKYEDSMESFLALIKKHNIHGLLYLNKWGETWCYGLTKGLFSGLPILYNDIGSFKERIPKDEPKYMINNSDEAEYYDYSTLEMNFERFLSYIRANDIFLAAV